MFRIETNNNVSLNFREAAGQNILPCVTLPLKFLREKIGYEEIHVVMTIEWIHKVKDRNTFISVYLGRWDNS